MGFYETLVPGVVLYSDLQFFNNRLAKNTIKIILMVEISEI